MFGDGQWARTTCNACSNTRDNASVSERNYPRRRVNGNFVHSNARLSAVCPGVSESKLGRCSDMNLGTSSLVLLHLAPPTPISPLSLRIVNRSVFKTTKIPPDLAVLSLKAAHSSRSTHLRRYNDSRRRCRPSVSDGTFCPKPNYRGFPHISPRGRVS